tara:strand:- start:1569 stop:2999 length:1431 start_codon:yes stop_codon:yes gene_type:complete
MSNNRDLLKEAIADAKSVKEVAIANAKLALEEAFTPHLKSMLSAKLEEMDKDDKVDEMYGKKYEEDDVKKEEMSKKYEEDDMKKEEMSKKYEEDDMKKEEMSKKYEEDDMKKEEMSKKYEEDDMKKEEMSRKYEEDDKDKVKEMAHSKKDDKVDEEINLDELLAELDKEEVKEDARTDAEQEGYKDGFEDAKDDIEDKLKKMKVSEEMKSKKDDMDEEMKKDKKDVKEDARTDAEEEGYLDGMKDEKEDMEDRMDDEDIDLEDMSEDDLKGFIETVIKDMVSAGEIEPGDDFVEDEIEVEDVEDVDVDVEIDEGMHKDKEDMDEAKMSSPVQRKGDDEKKGGKFKKESRPEIETEKMRKMEEDLKEALDSINELKSEVNEVNLLNAKLLYTNKIFKAKNLTENKKVKVLKAFDKAKDVKEARTIYNTLNEGLIDSSTVNNIKGSASRAGKVPVTKQPIVESDAMVARFKKLAGIIK